MAVIIKYPITSKKIFNNFIERKTEELTSLDWAKWAGWFDTDGSFANRKSGKKSCKFTLKDEEPVKLFSKTFEHSYGFFNFKTKTPNGVDYVANVYSCEMYHIDKIKWIAKNIYPFLIKEEKKNNVAKILEYYPESKPISEWTNQEALSYIATAIDGDGTVLPSVSKFISVRLYSSDPDYLGQVQELINSKFNLDILFSERNSYQTKKGERTMYSISINGSTKNKKNFDFYKLLTFENVMTLERKRLKIFNFLKKIKEI